MEQLDEKTLNRLIEIAKTHTERQFMLLLEFDFTWTVEEKLKFYYKHCDVEKVRSDRTMQKLLAQSVTIEEFLRLTRFDTTWTKDEKIDFYQKHCKK